MRGRTSVLARLVVLGLLACTGPFTDRQATIPTADDTTSAVQVRLRKLHLVRPDLIPYPISFEVYA
jgi:hypothetical protein